MLFTDRLRWLESRHPPFLIDIDSVLSGQEFARAVRKRAEQLKNAGVARHDRVLIDTGRGLQFFVDLLATWTLGACVIPLDFRSSAARLEQLVTLSQAGFRLGERGVIETLESASRELFPKYAAILFTSGSTGEPKGVALTARALEGNALATKANLELTPADILLTNIPFQFVSLMSHFLVSLLSGNALIATEDKMMQADFTALAERHGASCIGGSPTQVAWLCQCADHLSRPLRWIMSSGDHLSTDVVAEARRRFPRTAIHVVYGLTECGGRFCMLPASEVMARPDSVGRPIKGMSVSVRNEQGTLAPIGEIGEVYAKGDFLMSEYVGNPKRTHIDLTPHGFRTGDIGRLDRNGYLYLLGRMDDVFKCGGQKVSGLRIRDALMATGYLTDAAVLPWEHPSLGRLPQAALVFKPGVPQNKRELLATLRKTLPANHIPKRLLAISEIPRTGSGKVQRKQLEQLIESVKPI